MADKEKLEKSKEGLGISGFTLGILGIVFSGGMGIIVSLVGLAFCIVQQKKHANNLGKIGIILNIIGIVTGIAVILLYKFLSPLLNSSLLS